jgi:hypothetical protein
MPTYVERLVLCFVAAISIGGLLRERSINSLRGADIWNDCGKCDEKDHEMYECQHWNLEPSGFTDCENDTCLQSNNYYASCQDDWEDPPPCEVEWAYALEYSQQARTVATPPFLSCDETVRYLPDEYPEVIDTNCQEPGWGFVPAKCFLDECYGVDLDMEDEINGPPEYWEWRWVCVPPCEPFCE